MQGSVALLDLADELSVRKQWLFKIVKRLGTEGGLAAIAISHPHYYSAMVEWAHTFGCPVYLHEAERKWVMRPDPAIRFWDGETNDLGGAPIRATLTGQFLFQLRLIIQSAVPGTKACLLRPRQIRPVAGHHPQPVPADGRR